MPLFPAAVLCLSLICCACGQWSTARLSVPRFYASAGSANGLALIAGGETADDVYTTLVDVFKASTQKWFTSNVSLARSQMVSATTSNRYVIFAGGKTAPNTGSNVVDVYDAVLDSWRNLTLTVPRYLLAAVAINS
jgi:N-acetylneuraminic acid mutarotase